MLLDELERVLRRDQFRRYVTIAEVGGLIRELHQRTDLSDDPEPVPAVCRDPNDDYLIALAVAQHAILVSGDADLLEVGDPPAPILQPRAFLDALATAR